MNVEICRLILLLPQMNKHISGIIFFALLFFSTHSFSQSQDSLAMLLVKKHIAINKAKQTMPGYRVQLFFGPLRTKAYEMRSDFLRLYPKTNAYVIYQQPNFKVRVGDFRTRLEAMKFLKEVQSLFDSAFIVKDEVKLPEVN
jgi:hypothetical protein